MIDFPDLASLDDAGLKRLIDDLQRQETQISFERRVLQGRIDILRAGGDAVDVESIAKALTGRAPQAELSPEAAAQLEELRRQEEEISFRRRMLHGHIDILRAELVARLQRSGGGGVLQDVDLERLTAILAGKGSPPAEP